MKFELQGVTDHNDLQKMYSDARKHKDDEFNRAVVETVVERDSNVEEVDVLKWAIENHRGCPTVADKDKMEHQRDGADGDRR